MRPAAKKESFSGSIVAIGEGDGIQPVRLLVNDRKFLAGNSVFLSTKPASSK